MKKQSIFLIITLLSVLALSISVFGATADGIIAVKAIDFVAQGGGEVQFPSGRAYPTFSHWDYYGHWLEWEIDVPEDGYYVPAVMYGTNRERAERQLSVDGVVVLDMDFFTTGDFQTYKLGFFDLVELTTGKHIIRITVSAPAGAHAGVNPAWIGFLPIDVLLELDDDQIVAAVDAQLGL